MVDKKTLRNIVESLGPAFDILSKAKAEYGIESITISKMDDNGGEEFGTTSIRFASEANYYHTVDYEEGMAWTIVDDEVKYIDLRGEEHDAV